MKVKSILLTVVLYIAAMLLYKLDTSSNYIWIVFGLHIMSVLFLPVVYFGRKIFEKRKSKTKSYFLIMFLIIFGISSFVSFNLLSSYPFTTIGDELRDGGLDAVKIFSGEITHIFSYGHYQGYGMIIPTISSFLVPVFKQSNLVYRLPTALLSITEILILFSFFSRKSKKTIALFASIVLLNIPLHLFWARTEIVVMFNSFITTIVLASSIYLTEKKKTDIRDYAAIGLLFGFFAGFHTAARIVVLLGAGVVLFASFMRTILSPKKKTAFMVFIVSMFTFTIMGVIGFGPRLLETSTDGFFQSRSFRKAENVPLPMRLEHLGHDYVKTLMQYGYENTGGSHYPDIAPMLPIVLYFFFLIGLSKPFYKPSYLYGIPLFFAVVIPFTNSAMTESPFMEHRLTPLLPIAAIIVAFGIETVMQLIRSEKIKSILVAFLVAYIFITGSVLFFLNRSAHSDHEIEGFLATHAKNTLKDYIGMYPEGVCFVVEESIAGEFNTLHMREMFGYYFDDYEIISKSGEGVKKNQVYLTRDCELKDTNKQEFIVPCTRGPNFSCPKDIDQDFEIYLQ